MLVQLKAVRGVPEAQLVIARPVISSQTQLLTTPPNTQISQSKTPLVYIINLTAPPGKTRNIRTIQNLCTNYKGQNNPKCLNIKFLNDIKKVVSLSTFCPLFYADFSIQKLNKIQSQVQDAPLLGARSRHEQCFLTLLLMPPFNPVICSTVCTYHNTSSDATV